MIGSLQGMDFRSEVPVLLDQQGIVQLQVAQGHVQVVAVPHGRHGLQAEHRHS